MKVLLADDDETLRTELAEILREAGYEVRVAADGEEALQCLQEEPFDVALLDVSMPGPSGMDVLRRIQTLSPAPAVFMISGRGTIDMAVEAMRAGATDFVAKPFNVEKLERTLRDFQDKLEARRNLARVVASSTRKLAPSLHLPEVKAALLVYANGMLIGAKLRPGEELIDEDLLAATIDVIQNFMQTSFSLLRGKRLTSIVQGDFALVLVRGEFTYLTALIQGPDNERLREAMRSRLQDYEARNRSVLRDWSGAPEDARGTEELLLSLFGAPGEVA